MSVAWKVLRVLLGLFVAIVVASSVAFTISHKETTAFFKSAGKGLPLVEVLDGHPGWQYLEFAEKHKEGGLYESVMDRGNCGSTRKTRDAQGFQVVLTSPLGPSTPITKKSYSTIQDLLRADPQLFTKCPWVHVTYVTFMFERGTVDVQVDASGKIVLAEEPRFLLP